MSVEPTVQLEQRVDKLEALVAQLMQAVPEASMPEECRTRTCSYHTGYLAYGGPDLTHQAYHSLYETALEHMHACTASQDGRRCSQCTSFERRLRA